MPPANGLAPERRFAQIGGMNRYGGGEGGMGWTARILLVILGLAILGCLGLGVYAGTLKPPRHTYSVVIPNARFPS